MGRHELDMSACRGTAFLQTLMDVMVNTTVIRMLDVLALLEAIGVHVSKGSVEMVSIVLVSDRVTN